MSNTMSDKVPLRSAVRNDTMTADEGLGSSHKCYIDAENGTDEEHVDGSSERPFKTLSYAYIRNADKPTTSYLVRALDPSEETSTKDSSNNFMWKEPAKSAVKKAQAALINHTKKLQKQQAVEDLHQQQRNKALEEAKSIVVIEDSTLPEAVRITIDNRDIELGDVDKKGTRVKVYGRIHRLRAQKAATFITLVDGYGQLQCILGAGNLTKSHDALLFSQGTSLVVYGEIKKVPTGHSAPGDRELHVDYYEVLGHSPTDSESMTNRVSTSQNQWDSAMLDNRHLVLRGQSASSLMKLRAVIEQAFTNTYTEMKFTKVSPPALVQTQVEGGSTLFGLRYYDDDAFLTQSSQLYLETCIPSLGNVFAIEKSFRAEKSLTRRHLSEYTHVEAEMDFIKFNDLLEHLEEILCRVIDFILTDEAASEYINILNPGIKKPSRPFLRMRYSDAIDWLNDQSPPILNEHDKPHVFGDDIAEAAERKMVDAINKPILLTHFPADLKAFYMKKDPSDPRVTESVDLLMPGVGEVVGGSMRMEGYEELMEAFARHSISPKGYEFYTDQRKFGTSPHGGYGLGLERFLAWIADQHTVRTCCLYPRFMGRARP